jgi:hypothetical protein
MGKEGLSVDAGEGERRRLHHHIGERLGAVEIEGLLGAVGDVGLLEGLPEFDCDGAVGKVGAAVGRNELFETDVGPDDGDELGIDEGTDTVGDVGLPEFDCDGAVGKVGAAVGRNELFETDVGPDDGDELGVDEGTDVGQIDASVGAGDGRLEVDNEGAMGKEGLSVDAGEGERRRLHHHIGERLGTVEKEGLFEDVPEFDCDGAAGKVGETDGEVDGTMVGTDEGTDVGQMDASVGAGDGRSEVDNEGATGNEGLSVDGC